MPDNPTTSSAIPDDSVIIPIAHKVAQRYRSYVVTDDIAQELRLWWITRTQVVSKYLNNDDKKLGQRKLAKALSNTAERYARTQKALSCGYEPYDEFFYDSTVVTQCLPYVWFPDRLADLQRPAPSGKIKKTSTPSTGNNLSALVADVGLALSSISNEDHAVLYMLHALNWTSKDVANYCDISIRGADKKAERALERLVLATGGPTPWTDGPGSRRSITNAHATAITDSQEQG